MVNHFPFSFIYIITQKATAHASVTPVAMTTVMTAHNRSHLNYGAPTIPLTNYNMETNHNGESW